MDPIRKGRLGSYLIGRCVLLAALVPMVVVFIVRQGVAVHGSFQGALSLTAAAFVVTIYAGLCVRRDDVSARLLRAQPVWDVFYATGLLYLSGGWISPFVFLYPLIIIGAAAISYRRGAMAVATYSALSYGVLVALQFNNLIEPLNPFPFEPVKSMGVPVRLAANMAAFYIVAALAGYLGEELRHTGERLEQARDEILDLEYLQSTILRSMEAGLVAFDAEERVMFHNHAAEQILEGVGVKVGEEVELSTLFNLQSDERQELLLGDPRRVLGYTVMPLQGRRNETLGKMLTFRDFTERHKLERELKRADQMAAVGRLAAGLAHEIRNPLASLSGSVQILESLADREAQGEERQLFDIVTRETERLNRLVTDFLYYARPDRMECSLFDLRGLVEEMDIFFHRGEGREGFSLDNRIAPGLEIWADREKVEQLLLNLLRNSREATAEPVMVRVSARRRPPWLTLVVEDDGPGFSEEILPRAFEPFVSDKVGGTGLGLASVHRIAENHGGDVAVDAGELGGARFTIRFRTDDA